MSDVKYKHPHTDNTWTGKGQQPKWVEAVLAANTDATLESLEVGHKNYGSFIPAPVKEDVTVLDKYETGSVKKALAATKALGGKEGTFYQVPYKSLRVDPAFNIRDHSDDYLRHRKWLGEQIAENGYDRTKPMTGYVVKNPETQIDEFFLTDGFTRFGAISDQIEKGNLPADMLIPVMQANEGSSREEMTAALFTSNTGRQLTPMEMARVFKRLMGYGWDDKKIAARFDLTVPYIKDMMSLLTAPVAVREKVSSGKVAATEAVKLIKKVGGKGAEAALDKAEKVAKAAGKTKITAKHINADKPEKRSRPATEAQAALDLGIAVAGANPLMMEEVNEKIRDAIALGLGEAHAEIRKLEASESELQARCNALIADMVVYIKDVMMPTDDDAKLLLERAQSMLVPVQAEPVLEDGKPTDSEGAPLNADDDI